MKRQAFQGIRGGDIRTFSKTIVDDNFSKKTIFKGRVAHGILIAGLISAAVSKLPGVVIYRSQNLVFLKPVRVGDTI